ncbi:hypothetical protein ACA910_000754 [Epithemia clementina (nom. ined.)]
MANSTYRTSLASRERNRIHARKTRLRKKEHMQGLQQRADELKQQQLRLKQIIDEKSTASILVGFATSTTDESDDGSKEDPRVEELLRRPVEEIPDSSKIPELPALILPGQHASKKAKAESAAQSRKVQDEVPSEGFDIALLAKDRSKCTPEELDQIRRERNRMHAKRTRDRKRLFMEEMGEICRQLEEENDLLRTHLKSIDPDFQDNGSSTTDVLGVTFIAPSVPVVPNSVCSDNDKRSDSPLSSSTASPEKRKQPSGNHLQHLLEAACCYELSRPDDATSSALFAVVEAINEASSSKRLRQETTYAQPTAAVGC